MPAHLAQYRTWVSWSDKIHRPCNSLLNIEQERPGAVFVVFSTIDYLPLKLNWAICVDVVVGNICKSQALTDFNVKLFKFH